MDCLESGVVQVIEDAAWLAWLIDEGDTVGYSAARRPVAQGVIETVDPATRFMASDGRLEKFVPCLSGCNPHPLYVGCAVIRQARVSEWKLMF